MLVFWAFKLIWNKKKLIFFHLASHHCHPLDPSFAATHHCHQPLMYPTAATHHGGLLQWVVAMGVRGWQ